MIFNSLSFLLFFPVVTITYYTLPQRFRWLWLLIASCFFYISFIPIYFLILLTTIVVDYYAAIYIEKHSGPARQRALIFSIVITCLILFVFKYFDFFNINFKHLAHLLNWNYPIQSLKLLLPIGLSFHTFQSLSYVIEVYRRKQKAEKHFGIYALYVMFYPQLVAGPIERPQNLLHQFREQHSFNESQVKEGLLLMAWGFFKKMIIADRLAILVNTIYNDPHSFGGFPLIVATLCFAYQIYCDFSGYSDIARGAAQVMGFKLMVNFDRPYFSKTVSEFWQRWHISLSTWFRDYIYIPLGGNRVSKLRWSLNILITFLISGLWHGANWTYLAWGGLHAGYMIAELQAQKFFIRINPFLKTLTTFGLICFAWIFFRANSLHDGFYIVQHLGDGLGFMLQHMLQFKISAVLNLFLVPGETELRLSLHEFGIAITGIVIMELAHLSQGRIKFRALLDHQPRMIRWGFYYAVAFTLMLLGVWLNDLKFIYFQF